MEYNTQRNQLKITDYGRNIYKLIEYVKTVEDREKRSQMASAIVDIMANISQEPKEGEDYKRKFWVHLMILADWDLDVDKPYDISQEENEKFTPRPLSFKKSRPRFRHYGAIMENMIKTVSDYPEGEERQELVGLMAHAMKRDYLLWNRDTVKDNLISEQMQIISDNKLSVPDDFEYYDFRDYLKGTSDERRPNGTRKKKKKKK
ncbi:MAG: DUF4290 domain-containing protein [Bacteroidales bacterium]|nr:DUF4290 domain-containing protein [Bacteroidales bacterium]